MHHCFYCLMILHHSRVRINLSDLNGGSDTDPCSFQHSLDPDWVWHWLRFFIWLWKRNWRLKLRLRLITLHLGRGNWGWRGNSKINLILRLWDGYWVGIRYWIWCWDWFVFEFDTVVWGFHRCLLWSCFPDLVTRIVTTMFSIIIVGVLRHTISF